MKCFRRLAFHEVTDESGRSYSPSIVELDDAGKVLSVHQFQREEPSTIWVGGKAVIREGKLIEY